MVFAFEPDDSASDVAVLKDPSELIGPRSATVGGWAKDLPANGGGGGGGTKRGAASSDTSSRLSAHLC